MVELDELLKKLLAVIPEVEGAIISDRRGRPIASALPREISKQEFKYVNLINTMYFLNEKLAFKCFGPSEFNDFTIFFESDIFVTVAAGKNCLLTAYCAKDVKLGLILLDATRIAEKIAEITDKEDNKKIALLKEEWQEKWATEKLSVSEKKEHKDVKNLLERLKAGIPEIKGCMVINSSGEYICSVIKQLSERELIDEDVRDFAAFIERYLAELERDESFEYTISKFSKGYALMCRGHNLILMVFASFDVRLGLIRLDTMRTLRKIDHVIEWEKIKDLLYQNVNEDTIHEDLLTFLKFLSILNKELNTNIHKKSALQAYMRDNSSNMKVRRIFDIFFDTGILKKKFKNSKGIYEFNFTDFQLETIKNKAGKMEHDRAIKYYKMKKKNLPNNYALDDDAELHLHKKKIELIEIERAYNSGKLVYLSYYAQKEKLRREMIKIQTDLDELKKTIIETREN